MDSVSASNAVAKTAATTGTGTSSTSSTSATTKSSDAKSFATLFAEAKDDLKKGETLSKVDGHEFARIKGGTRDDMCINLSGNERSGQAFDLISRDGRQFHVYGGKGADHKVVEVGHKAADTTSTTTSSGTSTSGTTTSGTTTSGTTTAGTTTDSTSSSGGTSSSS
jgi:hypothetical protein